MNPTHQEFILCQNYYACQHALTQLLDEENSNKMAENMELNDKLMETKDLSRSADYPALKQSNLKTKDFAKRALDLLRIGPK